MVAVLDKIFAAVMNNKLVTLLGVTLVAFFIATTVLAVQKADLQEENKYLREELDRTTEATTTTPANEQSTTTEEVPPTTTPSMETTTTPVPTTLSTTTVAPPISYRLPEDNVPLHYDLWLNPQLEEGTFTGKVTIDVETLKETSEIVLHSHLLTIVEVEFKCLNESMGYGGHSLDADRHFLRVKTMNRFKPGYVTQVTILFSGKMEGQLVGLYSSSYIGANGDKIKIATSKFEPTFARQAFPCFDEPQLKATYAISLVHPSTNNYAALSNMDVEQTLANVPAAGLSTTIFNPSVPMSTYLVVFIVSDFQFNAQNIVPSIGNPFDLRVYATPTQIGNVQFALSTATAVIKHYIEYFNIEYPLPKLDMAAIPDFVSGAMETWGLVTYRETSILYNKDTSSTANKQRVAEVIAHELAHMWFGNLVTMKWWNELWLNEGFASYIEYKGVHSAYPDWGIMEQFAIDNLHGVLTLDATLGSHPIVVKVETPNQITEIFDTITYSKGASIIRMLEDFVSEPIFKQGVTAYLNKLKYGNGVSGDLMEELDALYQDPPVTVTSVMDTFTKQKGFPVVTVERVGNQLHLTQSRFLADPNANETEDSEFGYKWYIPLTYTTSQDPTLVHRKWFPNTVETVYIDIPAGTNPWVKLNHNQVGYYRVNYPSNSWKQFSDALVADVNAFSIGDRTGLLNDAFALADASQLQYDEALDLTKFLTEELEYVPWAAVSSKMKNVRNLIYDFGSYDDIIKYVRNLVQKAYTTVGWEVVEDNLMKNRLRTTILDLACSFGHEECLTEASKQFNAWLNTNAVIHPDVRSVVYYYGVQKASFEDWQKVKQRFREETDANEKTKLMSALAAFPDARVLADFLEEVWDSTLVREQDHLSCIQNVAANKIGEPVAWDHVRQNWDKLVDRFTLSERNLGRMIPSITGRFSSKVRLMELEDFFRRNPDAGAGANARVQALENVANNIKWLERNQQIVADWLKKELASSQR
ncbi:glutamyl aminopeptidase isoform X2 [Topomyia yanbarensis]|uniref:glutamyl aminopeptidase isoform X2 n=1 Tax=Topomyia yanbarensis TaxID=2498891 RepID=UPI00273BDA9D|nr:glutamyl aminopeptidase isoform X2 [Topomyia yanbarensis]